MGKRCVLVHTEDRGVKKFFVRNKFQHMYAKAQSTEYTLNPKMACVFQDRVSAYRAIKVINCLTCGFVPELDIEPISDLNVPSAYIVNSDMGYVSYVDFDTTVIRFTPFMEMACAMNRIDADGLVLWVASFGVQAKRVPIWM